MRLLVSAGEPSGDQRAAEVLGELGLRTPVEAFGLGGGMLAEAGMDVTMHMSSYAVMGFTEILASIPRFLALEGEMAAMAVERLSWWIIRASTCAWAEGSGRPAFR